MDLTVIIVNYNVKFYLEQCLDSVFRTADKSIDLEVFVVDNASTDDSVERIQQRFSQKQYPHLHIIANNRNVGFGRANNQAIKQAKGDYILFLNPDTILTEHTLSDCLAFARTKQDFGGLGAMMLHDNGKFAFESRRGLPTPWAALCKMTGLTSLFPKSRIFGKYYLRYLNKEEPAEIEIISGAYFMTTKAALNKIGSFDEEFFMYGEDIDLSYRLLLAGYKNYYYPTPMLHYKGESTHKSTFRYVHVFYNAMLIFFRKHFHCYWIGLSVPIKLAILLKALLALIGWNLVQLRDFMLPAKYTKEQRFLYLGTHTEEIKQIAEKWQLDIDCIHSQEKDSAQPALPKEAYQSKVLTVIYDMNDFSYEYLIKAFKHSSHQKYMGTYHPEFQAIITGGKVFSLKKQR